MKKQLLFFAFLAAFGLNACQKPSVSSPSEESVNISEESNTPSSDSVVDVSITKVSLKESPTKTEYLYGEELDLTGAKLEVEMSNGEKEEVAVESSMVSGYDANTLGEQTLTVSYEGFSVEIEVSVVDALSEVVLQSAPTKLEYLYGEALDLTGAKFELSTLSGVSSELEITSDMVSGYDATILGKQTITVNYGEDNFTFEVEVKDALKEVELVQAPTKVEYLYGEELDLTGAKLELSTLSGVSSELEITSDMVSGYDATILGKQTITVNYGEDNFTFEVEVKDALKEVELVQAPAKVEYLYGEELDLTGAKLKVVNLSGESKEVELNAGMISGYQANSLGKQVLTVSYENKETTFEVEVKDALKEIKLASAPTKTKYLPNETLDLTGALIQEVMLSGQTDNIAVTEEMVSGYRPNRLGTQTIVITYKAKEYSFEIEVAENPSLWTGTNINVIENGYEFGSWDNNGGANRLDYHGTLGDNNTISFKFTPSTTGNGSVGGESNFTFTVQTESQKIRAILKPYWCAAYIELNGSNLSAENYDPKTNDYNSANQWYDIKFVFATGYTELVIDYLGDGQNVYTKKIEDINFILTEDVNLFFTSWGANAGVKDIEFSKTEVKVELPLDEAWTGVNTAIIEGGYRFTSWDANGGVNRLNYNGTLDDNNKVSFKFNPTTTGNGCLSDTANICFAIETATQKIRVILLPYWNSVTVEYDGTNVINKNYASGNYSYTQSDGWFELEFIFASTYTEVKITKGDISFSERVEISNFDSTNSPSVYFTSWGANAGVKDIEFSKVG